MSELLDRSIPIPLYYQLKSIILRDIQNGVYAVGDQIPTEGELLKKYNVSRATIRQAILELVNEGLLERRTSKGTFVTSPKVQKTLFKSFEPFYQQVRRSGKTPRTEVLELSIIEADPALAKVMHMNVGDKVVTMFRRRYIDDIPMLTMRNYLPFSICGFILNYDFKKESLFEILMQHPQSRIKNTHSVVSAERAKPEDVALLNVKLDCPILVFHNTSISMDDVIVDLATTHYHSDFGSFEIDSQPE